MVRIFLLFILMQLVTIDGNAQSDTVRWYRQKDNTLRRTSNNPKLTRLPLTGRNQLIIVEKYNNDGLLVSRAATIDEECYVGPFLEFFANGKPKTVGRYTSHVQNGCGSKDGIWLSLSLEGDTLTKEQWEMGKFIKEVIPQDTNNLWRYTLMIGGKEFPKDCKTLNLRERASVKIDFKFKNSAELGKEHIIRTKLYLGSRQVAEYRFSSDTEFNTFDLSGWCRENFKTGMRLGIEVLQVIDKERLIGWYNVPLK